VSDPASADELRVVVDRLVGQVAHWTPSRWGAASGDFGRPRADVVHRLVQRIADLAALAEGESLRPVPHLDSDLALPDQLIVVTRDLLRAAPDAATLRAAHAAVAQARTALWG
jgi:hypothetical protein